MKDNQDAENPDEAMKALRKAIDDLLNKTYSIYHEHVEKVSQQEFLTMLDQPLLTQEHLELIGSNLGKENEITVLIAITALILNLITNGKSHISSVEKNYTEAWTYISKAEFWCGCLFSTCNTTTHLTTAVETEKSIMARRGGEKRAALKYGSLKTKVHELYIEKGEFPWWSVSDAARKIYTKIKNDFPNLARLNDDQSERTVSGWIKEIPAYTSYLVIKNLKQP